MKRILISTIHRPDRSPSQRYRFEQYLPFLVENGYSYRFSYLISASDDAIFYSKGNIIKKLIILVKSIGIRIADLIRFYQYDLVLIQRESFMLGTSFFEKAYHYLGKKVVFDFDDSIWLPNISENNKSLAFLKNQNKTAEIIKISDLVLAGNAFLANYAKQYNANVEVFPTTVDTEIYKKVETKANDEIIIGWSGSPSTIEHFKTIIPVLVFIKNKYKHKVKFILMGDPNCYVQELDLQGIAWTKKTEIHIVSSFDIGIMPLPDNEWTQGKCGLKGLVYMSLKVATVMANVGANKEIIQNGENGFLASNDKEWIKILSNLIENKVLRDEIGEKGYRTVLEKYSCYANKKRYLELFEELIK